MAIATSNEIATLLLKKLGIHNRNCTRVQLDLRANSVATLKVDYLIDKDMFDECMETLQDQYQLVKRNENGNDDC